MYAIPAHGALTDNHFPLDREVWETETNWILLFDVRLRILTAGS